MHVLKILSKSLTILDLAILTHMSPTSYQIFCAHHFRFSEFRFCEPRFSLLLQMKLCLGLGVCKGVGGRRKDKGWQQRRKSKPVVPELQVSVKAGAAAA